MKIAFVLDRFPSLTETFISRDIVALRHLGMDIQVFALHAGSGARPIAPAALFSPLWLCGAFEKTRGIERVAYFKGLGARWWRSLGAEGVTFDLIHAGWASHPALLAWGAAEASGLPWSFSGHARDLFVEGGNLAEKLALARFAAVCTHAGANYLRELHPASAEKIIYAPHGIEVDQIAFRDWSPPAKPLILAVGRLVEKKGFGTLLDALAILRAQKLEFTAQILGDGPLRNDLMARRDHLALRDCVQLPGAVSQAQVLETMHGAGCLVVPSLVAQDGDRDGLPNVVLEAAACGLPIVGTRAGAIEEFVTEETGWLCRSGNPEALAEALKTVFCEAKQARLRCRAARIQAEAHFDARRNAHVLAEAFRAAKKP